MSTARVRVSFPTEAADRSYDVLIHDGALDELGAGKFTLSERDSYFIVTDSNVGRLYGRRLSAALTRLGKKTGIIAFPAGEASKNLRTASTVASKLHRLGADRASVILALGGGVVGDLAGFVASIYKRGIDYIQLPTTLLAQVDSSIGGKTGIDTSWGKNQIGTFFQPKAVLTDPLTLRTLPFQETLNGLAEIIKCAMVSDRKMFDQLSKVERFDSMIPTDFIIDTCAIKARIVAEDEKETNLRAILNYGHTVGHAIEAASDYQLGHGVCLVLGMIAEGWIALRLGILGEDDFEKQSELLRRLFRSFVTKPPNLDKMILLELARADKKSTSSSIRMSLPREVGKMHATDEGNYKVPVSGEVFQESIDHLRDVFPELRK